jgi:hypothetical protein
MPSAHWPQNYTELIAQFEKRHAHPEVGGLLFFAVWAVDSLYYLSDLDQVLDPTKPIVGTHSADVVDVAHARWAVTTCITAVDLCAAGLGRAFCGHTNKRELALGDLDVTRDAKRKQKRAAILRESLPDQARQWTDKVFADPGYRQVKAVRDALTHARLPRHLNAPRKRMRLQVADDQIDVATIIECAKRVGFKHVSRLLIILPRL